MSHTTDLLDKYKIEHKIASDYGAAKALGLNPNAVSNYRTGLSHADDRTAVVLADALKIDRLKTIARINADRAKKPEDRAFWKRIASAAGFALAVYTAIHTDHGATAAMLPVFLHNATLVDIAHRLRRLARVLLGGTRYGCATVC